MYAQIVDDEAGRTLAAASTRDEALRGQLRYGGNKDAAAAVGKAIAERALQAGVGGGVRSPRVSLSWPRGRPGRGRPQGRIAVLKSGVRSQESEVRSQESSK